MAAKPSEWVFIVEGKKDVDRLAAEARVLNLPDLPPKGDVSDYLDAEHTVQELLSLAEEAPEWEVKQDADWQKPRIQANDRQLPDISSDAVEALLANNKPPALFVWGGSLVRIEENGQDRPRAIQINAKTMRGILARAADWYIQNR